MPEKSGLSRFVYLQPFLTFGFSIVIPLMNPRIAQHAKTPITANSIILFL
jgi:hypothetical protein